MPDPRHVFEDKDMAGAVLYAKRVNSDQADAWPVLVDSSGNLQVVTGLNTDIVTFEASYTTTQTNLAIVSVSSGSRIVLTQAQAIVSADTSVNVNFRIGFGASLTPTAGTGVVLTHPGILASSGSGVSRGDGSGVIGIGGDGEDLRITNSVPTGGELRVLISYYIVVS